MLKRDIKYTNFDDEEVVETFYFNLTKTELLELEVSDKDGFAAMMERIVKTVNKQKLVEEFKKLILLAYGERSEDGKRFIKNDEVREAFSQTAAFDQLFFELATDAELGAAFVVGIVPADISTGMADEELKAKVAEKLGIANPAEPTTPKSTAEIAAELAGVSTTGE